MTKTLKFPPPKTPTLQVQESVASSSATEFNHKTTRALQAKSAGEYLASVLGCWKPFSAQQMWAMARTNQIPSVRVGRRVIFLRDAIDAFASSGGTARAPR